jgi:uncharacterized protein (DUF1501 family)
MNRRDFLYNGFTGALAPVFLAGVGFRPMSASFTPSMVCDFSDRTLVVIYLAGANDIVNTTVPLNQFSTYVGNRPDIFLPEYNLIGLDGSLPDHQQLGLHPNLTGFKSLYDSGLLSIVQRVGYPTPNRSHFASEDIMLRGIDGTVPIDSQEEGWLGRFLKDRYPNYMGAPFGNELDPLGIILGKAPSTGFHTAEEHEVSINLSGQDPAGFYNIIASLSGEPITQFQNSDHGKMLQYLSTVEKSTQVYSERISQVFNAGANSTTNYPDSDLGDQLKTIARLLSGGSMTKVFMARKGGWDNHVNQVNGSDTTTGRHADLLQDVSDAVQAFQNDLGALGLAGRVTTVIFSEFARKIEQNGNRGTDHGTVSSMFIIGSGVNAGVIGDNLDLNDKDRQGAANPDQLQHDYRSVFSSILQDWLGASDDSLLSSFPNTPADIVLNKIPLVKTDLSVSDSCYLSPEPPAVVQISAKVFLEGFLKEDGSMRTNLLEDGLLPLEQPYGSLGYSYFGSERVTEFPEDTVDWMLLELWNQRNIVLKRQAVLLRKDGWLTDTEGNKEIVFRDFYPEWTHLVIYHRSHMGVFVKKQVNYDTTLTQTFDVTTASSNVMGKDQLKLVHGRFALLAGDTDNNGLINAGDYDALSQSSKIVGRRFDPSDLNGDGEVNGSDLDLWKNNRSKIGYPGVHKILNNNQS